MSQLPAGFLEEMSLQLPQEELQAFLQSYDQPYFRGLRMNLLKSCSVLPQGLLDPIPWEREAWYLDNESDAGAKPLHEAGAYYIQEPSAMLPVAVLDPKAGEMVLDLCAAPGGKTTQIAGRMHGQGVLVTNEPVPKRAQILSRNVERMGVTNAVVVSAYPEQLAAAWPGMFDAVLVDAPCSGEGMFRRHPETREEWSPDQRDGCAERQREILEEAAKLVRPGGRLVYSTCTMNHWENEDNAGWFVQNHPDFHVQAFTVGGISCTDGYLTCYPHRMRGEGQFAALFVRQGEECRTVETCTLPVPDKQQMSVLKSFGVPLPQHLHLFGDTVVSLPKCPSLKGIRVLRAGLHLGQIKGKLFQPDHAWAVASEAPEVKHVEISAEEAVRYQHGETIPVSENVKGWVLPCLEGLPLGWGKASDGVMKNHYPKGLRR